MDNTEDKQLRKEQDKGWGWYLVASLLVSALTLGILIYIGWFNGATHVDSRDSDVMEVYPAETDRPMSPGENDWEQIEKDGAETMDVIVDHAPDSEDNAPSAVPATGK